MTIEAIIDVIESALESSHEGGSSLDELNTLHEDEALVGRACCGPEWFPAQA